jgi:hypothetical protein
VVGKVERRDGAPLEPGLPEYLVVPGYYGHEVYHELRDIEIIDFGECKISIASRLTPFSSVA